MIEPSPEEGMSHAGDPGSPLEAALRVAFGPASTLGHADGGALAALRQAGGLGASVLLRDESDAPAPLVDPRLGNALDLDAPGAAGRYHVLGEIARGGMGIVLKGRDTNLGRDVAMKVLLPDHLGNPAMLGRFIEEAQVGGQLQHPGILPVYELGLDANRRPYFTMKLVKGRTLAALLEERIDLAQDRHRLLSIFEDVCQTLAYAHARGVIHRDLKPANIMVGAFGEVQIVDWGLSKVLGQGAPEDTCIGKADEVGERQVETVRSGDVGSQSQAGSVLGTPAYMSPEQAQGNIAGLDERADVFALGAILCEILTGQPPYAGGRAEILSNAAAGRLDPAFERLDACAADHELASIARQCLDPVRTARPRTGAVVAQAVSVYLTAVDERARAAQIAAAEAQTQAKADQRTVRLTIRFGSALLALIVIAAGSAFWAEHERRVRAEKSVHDVAALFWKADWFLNQADTAPDDQLELWERALAHVRRTAEIVGSGAIEERTRRNVERLVNTLKQEEAKLQSRVEELRRTHPDR
ncbi:MAG TPA: serine/threonine-protein kinase [Isosphaeraceae bacterium]|nr:serine/threonine-protein kinase [Isosphaeraceae bacterium]